MKNPISNAILFFIASVVYILLLVGIMDIFSVKDSEGYFSNNAFLLFGILYQIPISIVNSIVISNLLKKLTKEKIKFVDLLKLNIPLIWFPLSIVNYFRLYWVKNKSLK